MHIQVTIVEDLNFKSVNLKLISSQLHSLGEKFKETQSPYFKMKLRSFPSNCKGWRNKAKKLESAQHFDINWKKKGDMVNLKIPEPR